MNSIFAVAFIYATTILGVQFIPSTDMGLSSWASSSWEFQHYWNSTSTSTSPTASIATKASNSPFISTTSILPSPTSTLVYETNYTSITIMTTFLQTTSLNSTITIIESCLETSSKVCTYNLAATLPPNVTTSFTTAAPVISTITLIENTINYTAINSPNLTIYSESTSTATVIPTEASVFFTAVTSTTSALPAVFTGAAAYCTNSGFGVGLLLGVTAVFACFLYDLVH
jgi:hypothetical protein